MRPGAGEHPGRSLASFLDLAGHTAAVTLGIVAALIWTIPGRVVDEWLYWNVIVLRVERSLELLWRSWP